MMPDLGAHAPFIIGAYVGATIVVAALTLWILVDHRMQRRTLADMEAKGVKRRSASTAREEPA